MVSTSNWPPLVAMSVVTRWRSTFSSSVTHFTAMSGFLAVKSFVSPCILIMSLLFTVAIVSVVCAIEGAQTKRLAAPSRAPRTCFTVTSLFDVEHMPTPCNYVHTEFSALSRIGWRRQQLLVAADAKEAPQRAKAASAVLKYHPRGNRQATA